MSIENPFLNPVTAKPEIKVGPEIERSGRYFQRKERRFKVLGKILDEGLKPPEFLKMIKKIIKARLAKQEVLRPQHRKSEKALEAEYDKQFGRLAESSFKESEAGVYQEQVQELAKQAAYYELNPTGDWTETDGEVQEREFARGVLMQKSLKASGMSSREVERGSINPDRTDLEAVYSGETEKMQKFDSETAAKAINTLFNLQSKVDRQKVVEEMKKSFGCQEAIFILEDYFDSFEGYKENTELVLDERIENGEISEDFKVQAIKMINEAKKALERYQRWDEYYLVNGGFNADNLDKESLPIEWDRVGVTNNFLNALIYDYGELRESARSQGEPEFVKHLDEEIVRRFKEMNDEEAGRTVVRLAALRSCGEILK